MRKVITLKKPDHRDERGLASILSVVFFLLIASVITVGFMRITLLEDKQSLQDSLSKSALAAAYSGVNDAKRALYYCMQFTSVTAPPMCQGTGTDSIYNQSCPGFYESDTVRNLLNVADGYQSDESVQVGGDPAANERYTCVIISHDTADVSGVLSPDSADNGTVLIPLRGVGAATDVNISWQTQGTLAGLDYGNDPLKANYRSPHAQGNYFKWDESWPALLRVSLFAYPTGNIAYNPDGSTNIVDKTAFLYPVPSSVPGGVNGEPYASFSGVKRRLVTCTTGMQYMCQFNINGLDSANDFFLQLTSLNNSTHYSVKLSNGAAPVDFDGVSPQVDSTGAVESTFRRVQVRLSTGDTPILPNAIDTGSGICKDFTVSNAPSTFSDQCY